MGRRVRVDVLLMTIGERAEARGALLDLLARRLGRPAAELRLVEGEHGKPTLDPGLGRSDVRFNLSHSGNWGLLAIASGVELGVDLERITPRRDREYLADWTRREAYAKGVGDGLSGGVRQLGFERRDDGSWKVLDAGREVAGWRVVDLELGEALVGALATESEVDVSLRLDLAGA